MILLIKSLSNIITSSFLLFPLLNSFHASNRFSSEMISLYVWVKIFLATTLTILPPRAVSQVTQAKLLPVLEKTKTAYKLWFIYRDSFPKKSRYTLGDKIDRYFLEILELLHIATYQKPVDKIITLTKTIIRLDSLKFFLQLSWETKLLDTNKYVNLSELLHELGKIIGGWKKGLEAKTPT